LQTHRSPARRAATLAYWVLPSLFCLWLYRYGLRTWFMEDDFAWLGVNLQLHDWNSFWHAVFVPSQQGTIRPLSERLFFIAFWHMFGWQAVYYRVFVFLTQFFNLILLSRIVWKLTASRAAGFLAPILWTANASLTVAMSWTSGYNEVLCATFLLGAFALFLKFQETGKWRYYWLQTTVFIVGFGVLELNIIYPAIALCWSLSRVRTGLISLKTLALSTLPLFALSASYYALHAAMAPPQTAGAYAMHFDGAILKTVWTYCRWTFVSTEWAPITQLDPRLGAIVAFTLGLALLAFTIYQYWRGHYLPAFFLAWFFITLAPLAPLRDHLSDYYLSIPSLGPAVIAAIAVATAWRTTAAWKAAAMAALALYLIVQIPVVRAYTLWHYDRSSAVRNLVLGVASAHQLHPTKTLLLADLPPELYDTAIAHKPFRLIPGAEVYLAPQAVQQVTSASEYTLPGAATARALEAERLEVYSAAGPRLRNITSAYGHAMPPEWSSEYPRTVDAGNPLVGFALGRTWHSIEGAYRWMPQQASVRLSGPSSARQRLFLTGYCPKQMCAAGPVLLSLTVDGQPSSQVTLDKVEGRFTQSFALSASTIGKPFIEVQLQVSRTFEESVGGRTLSLAFGVFEIR
jgi:hypothetical protein